MLQLGFYFAIDFRRYDVNNILSKINFTTEMTEWLVENWMELFGSIGGFVMVYYSIKQSRMTWFWNFISATLYIFIFFRVKLYGNVLIFTYYALASIYGWFKWGRKTTDLKITYESGRMRVFNYVAATMVSLILGFLMGRYTDVSSAYGDAFITIFSILATGQAIFKKMENWISWFFVNLMAVVVYAQQGLYMTVALYVLLLAMSALGWTEWKKSKNMK